MLCTLINITSPPKRIPLQFPFHGELAPSGSHVEDVSVSDIDSRRGATFRRGINVLYSLTVAVDATRPVSTQVPDASGQLKQAGIIPSARLNLGTDPTDADTIGIGGHTFTAKTALGAAGATTQVLRGSGGASAFRLRLVDAIHGTPNAGVIPATTPFASPLKADVIDTSRVRIRLASGQGGAPIPAAKSASSANIALAKSLTAAGDKWDRANLNETGRASGLVSHVEGSVAITAVMILAGRVHIDLPFTPTEFVVTALTATGAMRATDDLITIDGDAIKIALTGGASPNLQATDVVHFRASA